MDNSIKCGISDRTIEVCNPPVPGIGNINRCGICGKGINPVQNKLDLVHREMAEIEKQMNNEKGMLSSDPRVFRLQDLWKECDSLENEIYNWEG